MGAQSQTPAGSTAVAVRIPNKVGRPRAFQDEDVYRVMMNVIAEVGYTGLTFALIAVQIKCTTSALIRRFGDKKSLLQGFLRWISQQQDNLFMQAHHDGVSPIERLRARWLLTDLEIVGERPEKFLAFFVEVRSDPAYRPQLAKLSREFEERVSQDVSDAIKARELESTDSKVLGHLVVCAMLGSISLWLDHQSEPFEAELNRTLDAVIAPYRA